MVLTFLLVQVVAGSYCTYMVKCDGSVSSCGEGSFGRLGHGGSDNENSMRTISALQGRAVLITEHCIVCLYVRV